ncbi:MAG: hypothetical protein AB1513_02370 [Pseudomonadota bacterium]
MNTPLKALFTTVLLCSATFAYAESETLREDLQPTLLADASDVMQTMPAQAGHEAAPAQPSSEEHFYVVSYDLSGKPKAHGVCPGSAVNWIPE